MRCPNCHTEPADQALFCHACAAALESTPPPARTRPQPSKRSRADLMAVLVAAVLLVGACGVGVVLILRAVAPDEDRVSVSSAQAEADVAWFGSAAEALVARLQRDGTGDWVYEVSEEGEDLVVYIAGPRTGEWVSRYTVERAGSGSWSVTGVTSLAAGGIGEVGAEEAERVVSAFLIAVSEDRAPDAQALAVDPFRSDPASAWVSAGGLTSFEVAGWVGGNDGAFWVQTSQVWYGSPENWEYWVVPTGAGMRIAGVQAF
ncbi:MAG: hypothetical protein ACYC6J_06915 [Coriobacteriia bacterium]